MLTFKTIHERLYYDLDIEQTQDMPFYCFFFFLSYTVLSYSFKHKFS